MKPRKIAVDLGGTIEDSWRCKQSWLEARGFEVGSWPISRAAIIEKMGGQEALYSEMAAEVYNDANIIRRDPVPGVTMAFRALAEKFRIVVASSRVESQRAITLEWLRRHGLVPFVSGVALLGSNASKLAWCRDYAVDAIIDDDVRHLEPDGIPCSIKKIHYCTPSCNVTFLSAHILHAKSWGEILNLLARELA